MEDDVRTDSHGNTAFDTVTIISTKKGMKFTAGRRTYDLDIGLNDFMRDIEAQLWKNVCKDTIRAFTHHINYLNEELRKRNA